MCGISGKLSKRHHNGRDFAKRANTLLAHRGPDGSGCWSNGNVTLAHVRLSIIDPSPIGAQPMCYYQDRFKIVFNGEIYNYIELKTELEALGYYFKTRTDTEVIPAAYMQWGEEFVSKLRGAFAFALWDEQSKELFLARDRLGEKPLFYNYNENGFTFASEFIALFKLIEAPLQLNKSAVDLFFHYGYLPENQEWISEISRIPAGSCMKVSENGDIIKSWKYWDFHIDNKININQFETFQQTLDEIFDIIVRSDVPVGVGLSGGIDSSAIAALAARRIGNKLHAFTVGYEGSPHCDERVEAREFAKYLGIPFYEVEIKTDAVVEGFMELVRSRNEPFVDVAGFGYLELFKAAHSAGVSVMMLGQGGDELFWGYGFLSDAANLTQRHFNLKKYGLRILIDYIFKSSKMSYESLKQGWKSFGDDRARQFDRVQMMEITPDFTSMQKNRHNVFTAEFLDSVDSNNAFKPMAASLDSGLSPDQMVVKAICANYLRENGLAQADRLAMSTGVEVRLPLCDFRLLELALGVKSHNSDRLLESKYWLREVMKSAIPKEIFERPKRGFSPPMGEWVKKIFSVYGHFLNDGILVSQKILKKNTAERWALGEFEWDGVFPAAIKALSLESWCRLLDAR